MLEVISYRGSQPNSRYPADTTGTRYAGLRTRRWKLVAGWHSGGVFSRWLWRRYVDGWCVNCGRYHVQFGWRGLYPAESDEREQVWLRIGRNLA